MGKKVIMKNEENKNVKRAFSIAEAAEYACVSRATLHNWIVAKLLPYEDLPGRGDGSHRFRLIRKCDLDAFLDMNYYEPNNKSMKKNSDELFLIKKKLDIFKLLQ